jgi:hypothetical protein
MPEGRLRVGDHPHLLRSAPFTEPRPRDDLTDMMAVAVDYIPRGRRIVFGLYLLAIVILVVFVVLRLQADRSLDTATSRHNSNKIRTRSPALMARGVEWGNGVALVGYDDNRSGLPCQFEAAERAAR